MGNGKCERTSGVGGGGKYCGGKWEMGNVSAPAVLVVVVEIMVGNGKCDFTSGVGGFGGKYYGGKWEM